MKMYNLKKKVALWLAFLMLFNVFAMFPISAASYPNWAGALPPGTTTTRDKLELNPNETLLPGSTAVSPQLMELPPEVSYPRNALLNWELPNDGLFNGDMYILRNFIMAGPFPPGDIFHPRRLELSVFGLSNDQIMVNFDVHSRETANNNTLGYRSRRDPVIWTTNLAVPLVEFRLIDDISSPIVDDTFGPVNAGLRGQGRWVNFYDRWDWTPPSTAGGGVANTTPNKPITTFNDLIGGFDPLAVVPGWDSPPSSPSAVQLLVPSFIVNHGTGFSFVYDGIEVHFLWADGVFNVYYVDILNDGHIYEFELERYRSAQAIEYYNTQVANMLWNTDRYSTSQPAHYDRTNSFRVLYLAGISGFDFIPFAHMIPEYTYDASETQVRQTLYEHWLRLPVGIRDQYHIRALDLRDRNTPERDINNPADWVGSEPVADKPGLLLFFDIPRLFDEDTGEYSDTNLSERTRWKGANGIGFPVPNSNAWEGEFNMQGTLVLTPDALDNRFDKDANGNPIPITVPININDIGISSIPGIAIYDTGGAIRVEFTELPNGDPLPHSAIFASAVLNLTPHRQDRAGGGADPDFGNVYYNKETEFVPGRPSYTLGQDDLGPPIHTFITFEVGDIQTVGEGRLLHMPHPYLVEPGGPDMSRGFYRIRQHLFDGYRIPPRRVQNPLVPPTGPGAVFIGQSFNFLGVTSNENTWGWMPADAPFLYMEIPLIPTIDPLFPYQPMFLQVEFYPGVNPPQTLGYIPNAIRSQIIFYVPGHRIPNIPLPENLIITVDPLSPLPPVPVVDYRNQRADVIMNIGWHIGTRTEILRLIEHARDPVHGDPATDYVLLDYIFSYSPIVEYAGHDSIAEEPKHLGVRVKIGTTSPSALPPNALDYLGDISISYTLHEVVELHHTLIPGAAQDPTHRLVLVDTPIVTSSANQISIVPGYSDTRPFSVPNIRAEFQITAEIFHRDIELLNPSNINPDDSEFRFPGSYFGIISAIRWSKADSSGNRLGDYSDIRPIKFTTFERSFLIDEWEILNPPLVDNLTVIPVDPTIGVVQDWPGYNRSFPSALNVSFEIPVEQIRQYKNRMFDFYPLVTTDLYIGAFPNTISRFFFDPPPAGVTEAAWLAQREAQVLEIEYDPTWNGSIDMTGYLTNLRGAGRSVIRIKNIPMIDILNNFIAVDPDFRTDPVSKVTITSPAALTATGNIIDTATDPYPIRLTLHGLDENTQYFLFAELNITPFLSDGARFVYTDTFESGYTSVVGATTFGIPDIIDPSEIDPPAPEIVRIDEESASSVFLRWTQVRDMEGTDTSYEVITIQGGGRMYSDNLSNRVPIRQVLGDIDATPSDILAWSLNNIGEEFKVTRDLGVNFVDVQSSDPYESGEDFIPDMGRIIYIFDESLFPNTLYFYYVRTVRTSANGLHSYSVWKEVTWTTSPVTAVVDLRDEIAPPNNDDFDLMSMRYLSWGHEDLSAILANYGTAFRFEIQIREEDGQWLNENIRQVSYNDLTRDTRPDSIRVYYSLSGLRPGTFHQVRVRLVDINGNDHSVWSNIVSFMTDQDPGESGLDRDTDDWVEHLRRLLADLLRRPFWVFSESNSSIGLVYRPDEMFAGILTAPNAAIELHSPDTPRLVNYIPFSIFTEANDANRAFVLNFDGFEVYFSPNMLNPNHNQAMLDMLRELGARGTDLSDIFIRVELLQLPNPGTLHGAPVITPPTDIIIDLVGTNRNIQNIRTWDRAVTQRVTRLVNNAVEDPIIRQNIRNKLINGDTNEQMLDYINLLVSEISAQVTENVGNDMQYSGRGILSSTSMPVTTFNAPMQIMAQAINNTFVTAFTQAGQQWIQTPTVQIADQTTIMTMNPSAFLFAGREINIDNIEYAQMGDVITAVVARHGLDDLFGNNMDLGRFATRHMVAGSIARMAGAPRAQNPINWVSQNTNVWQTNRTATSFIQTQEAIAMVMALYEIRTNTNLNNMQIRNPNLTAHMQIDTRHETAVRAAFELGIITDTELNMSNMISIGDFLDMLVRVEGRFR